MGERVGTEQRRIDIWSSFGEGWGWIKLE